MDLLLFSELITKYYKMFLGFNVYYGKISVDVTHMNKSSLGFLRIGKGVLKPKKFENH